MTLAPINVIMPTLQPVATVPSVLMTVAPLISTLAPGASESVTDAVSQIVKKANKIASIGIQNATDTANSVGDAIKTPSRAFPQQVKIPVFLRLVMLRLQSMMQQIQQLRKLLLQSTL